MLEQLRYILLQDCHFEFTKPVLLGVSGGPDSLCLFDLMSRLGCALVAAHFDHGLRPESAQEAIQVGRLAAERGVPFVSQRQVVVEYARKYNLSIEEAARFLRYRFLFEQAQCCGAQAVAVAHNADDQVETVLLHLLRGSGLAGLRGMVAYGLPNAWSQEIPLIRPLLSIWRSQIMAYCQERGLQPILDQSNLDASFTRNRLRLELIPYLKEYNPRLPEAIWQMAESLTADYQVLTSQVEAAWLDCLTNQGEGYVALDAAKLTAQLPGVQRGLLRRAILLLRSGAQDMDYDIILQALEFLAIPSRSRQRDLTAGLRLVLEGDKLWIAAWEADLPGDHWPCLPDRTTALSLHLDQVLDLCSGWKISLELAQDAQTARQQAGVNPDPYQAWLDADSLSLPLIVRARLPGDRFLPLGMEGHSIKVSDFMINTRLPRRARAAWPLVCSAGQVAWLPGYALGHPFRLTSQTSQVGYLKLSRG